MLRMSQLPNYCRDAIERIGRMHVTEDDAIDDHPIFSGFQQIERETVITFEYWKTLSDDAKMNFITEAIEGSKQFDCTVPLDSRIVAELVSVIEESKP